MTPFNALNFDEQFQFMQDILKNITDDLTDETKEKLKAATERILSPFRKIIAAFRDNTELALTTDDTGIFSRLYDEYKKQSLSGIESTNDIAEVVKEIYLGVLDLDEKSRLEIEMAYIREVDTLDLPNLFPIIPKLSMPMPKPMRHIREYDFVTGKTLDDLKTNLNQRLAAENNPMVCSMMQFINGEYVQQVELSRYEPLNPEEVLDPKISYSTLG